MKTFRTSQFFQFHPTWISYFKCIQESRPTELQGSVIDIPLVGSPFTPLIQFVEDFTDPESFIERVHGVPLAPNDFVGKHDHGENATILYYIEPGDAAMPLHVENGPTVDPIPGTFVYLEPYRKHWVERNFGKTTRYCVAFILRSK